MRTLFIFFMLICLTSCGFKPRGSVQLAPPLYSMYLETSDPYGQLTRNLKQFLKISGVHLTDNAKQASSTLAILSENTNDQLVGINGTQQTRQYNLILVVTFQVTNNLTGVTAPGQTLSETRSLTITNDQVLASSNEATSLYNQMRQAIVYDIMSRLSSDEFNAILTTPPPPATTLKIIKPTPILPNS